MVKNLNSEPLRPFSLFGRPGFKEPNLAWLEVGSFKSIDEPQRISFCPLTVLAGANSSGKSSMLQALLLLKQTLDVSYDPGAMLLDGANTRVSRASDLVYGASRAGLGGSRFTISLGLEGDSSAKFVFNTGSQKPVEVVEMKVSDRGAAPNSVSLTPHTKETALRGLLDARELEWIGEQFESTKLSVGADRFFLNLHVVPSDERSFVFRLPAVVQEPLEAALTKILHLPGLRGNPERNYPRTAFRSTFPGQFQEYVASIIASWQENRRTELGWVAGHLETLGLTWKVVANEVDDTKVELRVGRLPHARQGGAHDLVNIADVGLGVSQVLPVLVALRLANPGQLILIEQPEIHLHPRAQSLLASPIVEAAMRGVRVVVETHSALLLRGIQTKIAKGELDPNHTVFHWFERDPSSGATTVRSVTPDHFGAIGDWPIDFDETALMSDSAYLDAVEQRALFG